MIAIDNILTIVLLCLNRKDYQLTPKVFDFCIFCGDQLTAAIKNNISNKFKLIFFTFHGHFYLYKALHECASYFQSNS